MNQTRLKHEVVRKAWWAKRWGWYFQFRRKGESTRRAPAKGRKVPGLGIVKIDEEKCGEWGVYGELLARYNYT